tara:strand:- start:3655 stop:4128 length:474 start_codon:yes stop_codon:yes gene_type:complete
MHRKTKKKVGILSLSILLLGIFLISGYNNLAEDLEINEITIIKSPNCGCCSGHAAHLRKNGFDVNVKENQNMNEIKKSYNILQNLQSCHTSIVGDYFVEGHVPAEAIAKLIKSQPDIAGISLPAMPSGSPGMPGKKMGDFVIFAIHHDGSTSTFMEI